MIAKFLKESVILQKDNRDGLIAVMRKLNGKGITGSLNKYHELGWWFTKDFENESVICFSYVYFSDVYSEYSGKGSACTCFQNIYLFVAYKNGEKTNVERRIGRPFFSDDTEARKISDAFVLKSMKELMRLSSSKKIYSEILAMYYKTLDYDWTKKKVIYDDSKVF